MGIMFSRFLTKFIILNFLLFVGYAFAAQHQPYQTGDCTLCHNDANPQDGSSLVAEGADLCYQCHERKDTKKFVHAPVGSGICTMCHNPHESNNPKLLNESRINDLCTTCHYEKGEMLKTMPTIHPPVKDSCINCHDPHTSDFKFQLKADRKKDLCFICHTDKKELAETAKRKHGALDRQERCLNCHDPHGSQVAKLLRAPTAKDLCLKCHNSELRTNEDGQLLTNMARHLEEYPDWHGPTLWGDCAACHNPHGSDNHRMLRRPFPTGPVSQFSEDGYICFACHEPEKVKDQYTEIFTDFRNGKKNLHFIHVNRVGIVCRTCHDFHATKEYPHHLRIRSQFGTASFSLRYIETPDGGSCDPICHNRRHYDRVEPKPNVFKLR